jgi:hypothetical protein
MDWEGINWKTGFYRLWLVASVLWCIWVAYDVIADWNNYYSSQRGNTGLAVMKFIVFGLGPCAGVAAAGLATGWALKGFRASKR